ncbi:hypothetical protein GCM10010412_076200 [Nonomuraea recticatena]|uniref:Pyridoxamine 5'-phosphate oxidase N-terminal domain-containing protein n=2 Tax=Nonomuraea recticatena TaxID=46178 RepID=A0ABP6FAI3_9ACTN
MIPGGLSRPRLWGLRSNHSASGVSEPSRVEPPPSTAAMAVAAGKMWEFGGRRCRERSDGSVPGADHDNHPGGTAMRANEITEILDRPISRELLARDVTRLAYVAKDGTPRNVPIAFTWNGSEIVMCTSKNAPKLPALRANPMVALTIDTEVHPPKILLIRGRAELDVVDGIPDEYLQMNGSYQMTPEQRVGWEAEVRSLYDGMVRIVVTPTWAKLIDFETTLPSAVEELVRQREERRSA